MEGQLRISVLGPLAVSRGETELAAGPPQQRALLTALVLRRGRPASIPQLIAEIWGETAPTSADAILRQYVHGLRRTLGSAAGLTLRSSHRAYVVDVSAGVLDLEIFERLVAESDDARTTGDPAAAADRLRQALALWRGEALGGVPGPGAESHRLVLAQQHLSALTACAGLDLELGRHREVQPQLQALVLAHPLNEHLRQLLMTALYRCGRQSDALATYQECARLLADELGVDPGPELRDLYLRLLREDPPPAGAGPAPKPAALPAAPAAFVGREETLRRAGALLDQAGPGPVMIVLTGMGGVGKTTTALHWAHQVAPGFPDGQLYADLRGYGPTRDPASLAEVLDGFLRALGVAAADIPEYPSARAALFRSLLAGRRMLVLLDNVDSAETARELLPGSGRSLVLMTSRRALPGLLVHAGVNLLALRPPEHDEALALFAAKVGQHHVRAEPGAARDIVERSGRLPLALAVIAARVTAADHLPLAAIAAELGATDGTLTAFRTADPSADVSAALSWSYRLLSRAQAEAFRRLSLHPGPHLTLTAAASMLALNPNRTRGLLTELTAAALLSEVHPSRYAMHDLIRTFGHELAQEHDDEDDQRAVLHRMLDHYLHTSWPAAHQLFEPRHRIVPEHPVDGVQTDVPDAAVWFDTEHPALLAAIDLAAQQGFDRHVWQLSWLVRDYLNRHGLWHHLQSSQLTALAAAERSGTPPVIARVLWGVALVEGNLGRYEAAHTHLRRSLTIFTVAGDQVSAAFTRRRIIYLLTEQDDFGAALDLAKADLAQCPPGTGPERRANALNTVSWLCTRLDLFDEAVAHAREAVTLAQFLRPFAAADLWDTLGSAQAGQGSIDAAEDSYRQAAEIYHRQGAVFLEAQVWRALGDARRDAGRGAEAGLAYRQSLDLATATPDPRAAKLSTDLQRVLSLARSGKRFPE